MQSAFCHRRLNCFLPLLGQVPPYINCFHGVNAVHIINRIRFCSMANTLQGCCLGEAFDSIQDPKYRHFAAELHRKWPSLYRKVYTIALLNSIIVVFLSPEYSQVSSVSNSLIA
uniref:G_PROTEIN_RECEP_F1_2 domain-containing protein n=1 Tax=Heterorhabditis bacteriophora TaxID=37862 RepID=A0A1I7W673_HETBA